MAEQGVLFDADLMKNLARDLKEAGVEVRTKPDRVINRYKVAVQRVREAQLFEDGISGDLHELSITSLSEAYLLGRVDALDEIDLLVRAG